MEYSRRKEHSADAKASRLSRIFGNRVRIYTTSKGVSVTGRGNRVIDAARLEEIRDIRLVSGLFGSKIIIRKSDRETIRFNTHNLAEARAVVSALKKRMRTLAESKLAAREKERRRIAEVAAQREKARREEAAARQEAAEVERRKKEAAARQEAAEVERRKKEAAARQEAAEVERRKKEAAARQEAARLTPLINRLVLEKDERYSARKYARYSDTVAFTAKIKQSLNLFNQSRNLLVDHMLGEDVRGKLKDLENHSNPEFAGKVRQDANDRYKKQVSGQVMSTAHRKLGVSLTSEQAEAAATNEDNTLVLAGAGSGKTVVITAKATHLVEDMGLDPERILILAFNRDAAQEIRDRLPRDVKGITVKTFHAVGLQIVAEASGVRPSVSYLAVDESNRRAFIEKAIREAISDPARRDFVYPFLALYLRNVKRPFDFGSEAEYLKYTHEVELRSLNGERVKSREELIIANFLFINGVTYEYEKGYVRDTADVYRSQYRADFYLTDYDIYIEHFALDKSGHAPTGWMGYEEGINWKRETHRTYGTKLIETYSWQNTQGILKKALIDKLQQAGVKAKPIPSSELVSKLRDVEISNAATLLDNFLSQVKTYNRSMKYIETAVDRHYDQARAYAFLQAFRVIHDAYQKELERTKSIDFEDAINQAVGSMEQGYWQNPYDYVLVDEFQDINAQRLRMVRQLAKAETTATFLVGDDWQTIYAFAGSDPSAVADCHRTLGFTERVNLAQTFRFNSGILEPTQEFIRANPVQTQRTMKPNLGQDDRGITVMFADEQAQGADEAARMIREIDRGAKTLPLTRFRKSKSDAPKATLEASTIHAAKGREADYAIILDLKDDLYGLPSKISDDPILDLARDRQFNEDVPFAEERRLLYVAMTRARKGVYLIAHAMYPSQFVTELIKRNPNIPRVGVPARECPRCKTGRLVKKPSKYNQPFFGCTNYPITGCTYKENIYELN